MRLLQSCSVGRLVSVAALTLGIGCTSQDERDTARDSGADTVGTSGAAPRAVAVGVASPPTDTVSLRSVFWDRPDVHAALVSAGLEPRLVADEIAYPGMSTGIVLGIADAELQIFFFGDVAAADRALQAFDPRRARQIVTPRKRSGPPHGFVNNNMVVLLFSRDGALKARLDAALAPEPERLRADDAEP